MDMLLKKYTVVIIPFFFLVYFFLALGSSLSESQTIDEGVHLSAGYSYLVRHDYRLNPEHPPLLKIFSAFPLLFLGPEFPDDDSSWIEGDQWSFARRFLYNNEISGELLLQVGRLPNMLVGVFLGVLIFLLTRMYFGSSAAFLSLLLYTFDPLFLAHGHYVTTDLGLALFFLLAVFFWGQYLENHQHLSLFLSSLFFALAQATKFSAVVLFPIFIILFLIRRLQMNRDSTERFHYGLRSFFFSFFIILSATVLVLFFVYQGYILRYWDGFNVVAQHNATGHLSFLFGDYSTSGWWYYFPLAFFVKTPLATIIAFALAILFWLKKCFLSVRSHHWTLSFFRDRVRKLPFSFFVFFVPPIVYVAWSMTSHINLGVRHLTPIYPFLFLFLGSLVTVRFIRGQVFWRMILVVLLLIHISMTLLTYPRFISYFSEIVGGSRNGYRYLLDSNTDWGQGLKHLAKYLKDRSIDEPVYLAALNTVDPRYYDIEWRSFPDEARLKRFQLLPPGVYVLSASYPLTGDLDYQWLLDETPTARVADVYFIYDVR